MKLIATVLAGAITGAATTHILDRVQTESVRVQAPRGNQRINITPDGVRFFDKAGKLRMVLGVSDDGPVLSMFGPESVTSDQQLQVLLDNAKGAGLLLRHQEEEKRVALGNPDFR